MEAKRFPYTFLACCEFPAGIWTVVVVAILPLTDSYKKSKKKEFRTKIFIIKGFFLSLNREKLIKNTFELLKMLLAVNKALQRQT